MWGQNFFRSAGAARRFAHQVGPADGASVVEIGSGSGMITRALAERDMDLIAVEIDDHWARHLSEQGMSGVSVVRQDFLSWNRVPPRFVAVGNLPFGASTEILRRCMGFGPDRMTGGVFLLQREFARKRSGSYGGNLFNAQWEPWFTFRGGLEFARHDFRPVPGADTKTLLIAPRDRPLLPWADRHAYQKFVDAVFNTGHMTIGEAARKVVPRGSASWLRRCGVPSGLRVKNIGPEGWADLFAESGAGRRPSRPSRRPRR